MGAGDEESSKLVCREAGQALMSAMGETTAVTGSRANRWSRMTGVAFRPMPARHPTLRVGQRSVPSKLCGWWMIETSFKLFATRRRPRGWVSHVICTSMFALVSIAPVKPAMFRFPDLLTAMSKFKREAWRIMVLFFISMN